MCNTRINTNGKFSSEQLRPGTHICLAFRDELKRRRIMAQFVESGVVDNERVLYFADIVQPSEVVDWLAELDVDVSAARAESSFSVQSASKTYCPDGTFKPNRMLDKLKSTYSSSLQEGHPAARVTGEMSWALRGFPGSERLMEYEIAINSVVKSHPITAMCQYDMNQFDPALILYALQVHPYMIMDTSLVKNPYYIVEA